MAGADDSSNPLVIDIGSRHDAPLKEWVNEVIRLRIRVALLKSGGDVRDAAKWLGTSKDTIYRHLRLDQIETEEEAVAD